MARLILAALAPSAIGVSLQAAEDLELERTERQRHWSQRLERARYETTHSRAGATRPWTRRTGWSRARWNRIGKRRLASSKSWKPSMRANWHAPMTTAADRQMIARLMLQRVSVRVDANSEHVEVACHWAGGVQTRHAPIRAVQRFGQLRGFDQMLNTIRTLRQQGCSAAAIAEQLNTAGWWPPKRAAFDASMIQRLAFRHKLGSARPIWSSNVPREPGVERTLQEAAARLGIHRHTAYHRLRRGKLRGRMVARGDQQIWIVQMTEAELDQVKHGQTGSHSTPDRCTSFAWRGIVEKRSNGSGFTCGRTSPPTACSPTTTPSSRRAAQPGTPSWPCPTASGPSQPELGPKRL